MSLAVRNRAFHTLHYARSQMIWIQMRSTHYIATPWSGKPSSSPVPLQRSRARTLEVRLYFDQGRPYVALLLTSEDRIIGRERWAPKIIIIIIIIIIGDGAIGSSRSKSQAGEILFRWCVVWGARRLLLPPPLSCATGQNPGRAQDRKAKQQK